MNEFFHKLWHDALLRDCPILRSMEQLHRSFGCGSAVDRSVIVEDIADAGADFIESTDRLCSRVGHPVLKRMPKPRCPTCGSDNCLGAVSVVPVIVIGK